MLKQIQSKSLLLMLLASELLVLVDSIRPGKLLELMAACELLNVGRINGLADMLVTCDVSTPDQLLVLGDAGSCCELLVSKDDITSGDLLVLDELVRSTNPLVSNDEVDPSDRLDKLLGVDDTMKFSEVLPLAEVTKTCELPALDEAYVPGELLASKDSSRLIEPLDSLLMLVEANRLSSMLLALDEGTRSMRLVDGDRTTLVELLKLVEYS